MGKAPGPSHAGLGCPSQVPLQPPRGSEVSTADAPRDTGKTAQRRGEQGLDQWAQQQGAWGMGRGPN